MLTKVKLNLDFSLLYLNFSLLYSISNIGYYNIIKYTEFSEERKSILLILFISVSPEPSIVPIT